MATEEIETEITSEVMARQGCYGTLKAIAYISIHYLPYYYVHSNLIHGLHVWI